MLRTSSMRAGCLRKLLNKRGSEMVEASISIPIIILAVMLLLRLFVFYLQIINTSLSSHEEALEAWDAYSGNSMHYYESNSSTEMLKGGLLGINLEKKIVTKAYFFNEDNMVRAGELVKE